MRDDTLAGDPELRALVASAFGGPAPAAPDPDHGSDDSTATHSDPDDLSLVSQGSHVRIPDSELAGMLTPSPVGAPAPGSSPDADDALPPVGAPAPAAAPDAAADATAAGPGTRRGNAGLSKPPAVPVGGPPGAPQEAQEWAWREAQECRPRPAGGPSALTPWRWRRMPTQASPILGTGVVKTLF